MMVVVVVVCMESMLQMQVECLRELAPGRFDLGGG